MSERLFKVLARNEKGELVSCNGGTQTWTPGVKVCAHGRGPLVACNNGIHLCRPKDLLNWLNEVICPVTRCSGERIIEVDKVVMQWAVIGEPLPTWNDRTARLFACDCAEWALSLLDKPDPRSVEAVRVSRLFAVGKATAVELAAAYSAALAAAYSASLAAAWVAARAAASEYMAERLMQYLDGGADDG